MLQSLKKQHNYKSISIEHDETFAFIAGYTAGGAPFGITHEEMKKTETAYISLESKMAKSAGIHNKA